ncbi:hypothetical protein G3480_13570 [Thiorhodococcus mannitoliphagus]|uniref:C-type lysozyme inhibitor domain-containing protein n=1 Tax=Thiorhodococcus mannitoliphagus TaxID=329406 RepID=A0A6P1DT86_9GAMM|nr:hypothetical protein [Thiorhodococcus mannitoliphagus]NEX21328.1 hypothetical protein [Thiorhodococcus mannitoliphagus]
MNQNASAAVLAAILMGGTLPAAADSTQARCELYPKGSDKMEKMLPCTFSQRQGYITIIREDGVTYDLSPVGDTPSNFRDRNGRAVYRQSGLGEAGQIFRFPTESLFVYWDNAATESAADNATAPFATKYAGGEYDATTLLRCKTGSGAGFGQCPAGILRMENGQASIVIQSPRGVQFTVNVMTDYVNATVGEVKATLNGDLWTLIRDNGEVYEVPLSAIEGG